MIRKLLAASLVLLASGSTCAFGQDLVYRPINPSFGGNPLNSSHLLGLANAQRDATASDADDDNGGGGGGGTPTDPGDTDVDLFIRQLQGRLLSALASQVTEAIFGDNPQDSGTIQFGDTTVEFDRTVDSITLRITAGDGTVTVITVPQLVTSNALALSGSSALGAPGSSSLSTSLSGGLGGSGSLSGSLSTPLN